jgi:ribosomal protein S18 acetylase RimI-like enzyme
MNAVQIRPIRHDDVPVIASWLVTIPLYQRYKLTADRAIAQFEKALGNRDMLLAADGRDGESACGFAWCIVGGAFGRSVYLRLIGVRPERAEEGIGSALLAASEQDALKISSDLFLLVSDFNHDAQRFYQKHGYQQIGAIPGYVLPDVTELIYWKHLGQRSQTR